MIDNQSTITSDMGVLKIGRDRSPILPKVKDANVNLRDRLNDVLISEKYILSGYGTAVNEIIDQRLLDTVMKNMMGLTNIHKNMVDQLFDLGEYQADVATPIQTADALDMFKNYMSQMPYPQNQ